MSAFGRNVLQNYFEGAEIFWLKRKKNPTQLIRAVQVITDQHLDRSTARLRPHFDGSLVSAFFTSDWEIRNCRAIRDGVKPALKAARIAFSFP
jgi:hypothetical protein